MTSYEKFHFRFEDLKENHGINTAEIILHNDDVHILGFADFFTV